jgi:hypothetical protein
MSILQIAALPQECINSRGNPNGEGWASLKRDRKRAVFKGIIGVPSSPVRARGVPLAAGSPFAWRISLGDFWYGAANPGRILAGKGKTGRSSVEQQYTTFAGPSGMAGEIALTFQLASKGQLGANRRPTPRHAYPERLFFQTRLQMDTPWSLPWQGDERLPGDPPPQAIYEDDGEPPWHRQLEDNTAPEASASASCVESEENLQGEWPSWSGYRDEPCAVIALDPQKGKQLLRFWLETGYLQSADADGRDAVGIVAAAVRKGQGLLLTIRELSWDQYAVHTDAKKDDYKDLYGKLPMDLAYGEF